jgi:cytochrome c
MRFFTILSATAMLAAPAAYAGDAAVGERDWRQCRACHEIVATDGTVIQRGPRTGPNLYGVVGRTVASVEGFRYSTGLAAVGAAGVVWDEENLVAYLANPTDYIRSVTGDRSHRGSMAFQMRSGAADMVAYLASVGPQPTAEEAEAAPAAN